ncbi:MAG: hypothetical protein ACI808_001208 [Paraglaciecola sp.]|jgi:hypothetical protein
MKKLMLVIVSGMLIVGSSQLSAKAEVEITWQNPEKFRDVKPANDSRKRFRERTFKKLDEYFVELAERLPDGQKLLITVDDLDLAGQVWPASFVGLGHGSSDVRLIKSIDIPRMSFQYKLEDMSGEVLQEAEVKLKDMSFQDRHNPFFRSENLRYEKNMLRDWFNDEFPEVIVKN